VPVAVSDIGVNFLSTVSHGHSAILFNLFSYLTSSTSYGLARGRLISMLSLILWLVFVMVMAMARR